MNFYIVIRWGNDDSPDGPNGTDTVFLVRAPDRTIAVSLVEPVLKASRHERVVDYANVCLQIGTDQGVNTEPSVLLGPIVHSFFNKDYPVGWVRHYEDLNWDSLDEIKRSGEFG